MKKEIIGIIVCMLLVGTVLPVTGTIIDEILLPPPTGDTFYVGGSGEDNYTRIQDAINESVDGDTVFVYGGTYIEKIEIDVSIDLIGEDKYTTIIEGEINVDANYVKISGFTVKNTAFSNAGIQICKHSFNTIMDNIVKDCYTGIYIHSHSYQNTIIGNLVCNNIFVKEDIRWQKYLELTRPEEEQ